VPLPLEQVLTFYLDPPDDGPYGTGLYKRNALKAGLTRLSDQHASYVLATGGRIPGIVAPHDAVVEGERFTTLVNQFRSANEAADAAKRNVIVSGPVDFTPQGANPTELGLIELMRLSREDTLAAWGVPPTQAGIPAASGLNSGERGKYDEATLMQGSVHDRVVAIREPMQYGLLDRWKAAGFTIDVEIEEPQFDDRSPLFALAQQAVSAAAHPRRAARPRGPRPVRRRARRRDLAAGHPRPGLPRAGAGRPRWAAPRAGAR
jgi:hypothetical protein